MESDNSRFNPAIGVSATSTAQDSTPESTGTEQGSDSLKNVKSEMNRKFSKMNEKIDQLLSAVVQSPRKASPVEETDNHDAPDYKRYVDSRFQEVEKDRVRQGQEEAWSKALELFPELSQESESYDEKFYKAADKFYSSFDLKRDPEAPIKAVKLAALELGKIEQLAKEKLLRDEARRSRIISEGSASPRDSKKDKEPNLNERNLGRLGINPEKLKARIKANKDKYGE